LTVFFSQLRVGETIELDIDVGECKGITQLEHVVANVSYSFHRRGDVKIILISPSKTSSELLSYRKNDATDQGIH
jgi:subtilisin-like proprotein convertase family protein